MASKRERNVRAARAEPACARAVSLVLEALEWRRLLASTAGALDPTFGNGGRASVPVGNAYVVYGSALGRDGKLIAVGAADNYGDGTTDGTGEDFLLARFNADGSPDASFGSDGVVTTDFANGDDEAHAVAYQADGKILVAGSTDGDFALARYNLDGSLDTSFGAGGKATADFASATDDAYGLVVEPDGSILLTGNTDSGIALARFTSSGKLDPTFGDGGETVIPPPTKDGADATLDGYGGAALLRDGRVLIVGDEDLGANANGDDQGRLAFAYVNPDGSVDALKFGPTQTGTPDVVAFAVQRDGKVVTVGSGPADDASGYGSFALERHNPDGSLDASFANGGRTADLLQSGSAVALDGVGHVLVTGSTTDSGAVAVARFNPDGSDDATFGLDGVAYAPGLDYGGVVAVQRDGKIVAAGIGDAGVAADQLLPNVGVSRPTASLDAAPYVTARGTTDELVTVTYRPGSSPIDASTIDDTDLTVTSPTGHTIPVSLQSATPNADGSVTAVYEVQKDDAGHKFNAADDGRYTIALNAGEVLDVNGAPAAGGAIGAFRVTIPQPPGGVQPPTAALSAPYVTAPAATDATFTVTYKATSGSTIDADSLGQGEVSVTGPNGFEQSATYVSSTTNADGSVTATYIVSKDNHEQFTPADNGAYRVTLAAGAVSDDEGTTAPDDASLGSFRVIVPPAPANGTPPTARMLVTQSVNNSTTLTVTYKGAAAIAQNTLDDFDLSVTSPGATASAQFNVATVNGDGSVTAIYTVSFFNRFYPLPIAAGGTVKAAATSTIIPLPPIGGGGGQAETFTVKLLSNQVSDTTGVTATAATIGTFQATVPTIGPIELTGNGTSGGTTNATGASAVKPVARGARPVATSTGGHHHHRHHHHHKRHRHRSG